MLILVCQVNGLWSSVTSSCHCVSESVQSICSLEWKSRWRFQVSCCTHTGLKFFLLSFWQVATQHFVLLFFTVVTRFRRWVILSGVILWVEVLRLPSCAHEASCFSKISGKVDVFFPPLNLSFETATGLAPSLQKLLGLFVPTFLSELLILMSVPHWL